MTKQIIILLTAILTTVAATASDNINFMHLTVKDGLCHNQISNIIRDSRGFMWFATTHGLSRYDGYEFKNYLKSTSVNGKEEIPSTSIVDIQEDADGMLWIKFNSNQYFCFNPKKETLTKSTAILTEKYGIDEEPSEIYVDSRNDMWIKTKSGNMYHNSASNGKTILISSGMADSGRTLSDITSDLTGVVAIYSDGYIEHINYKTNKKDYTNSHLPDSYNAKKDNYRIYCDNDGDYWIHGTYRIWKFNPNGNQWTEINHEGSPFRLSGTRVRNIVPDNKGRIWIALDNGGLNIIDKKTYTVNHIRHNVNDSRSLGQDGVTCLYADNDGGIWVGTFKRGVSYHNEKFFKFKSEKFRSFNNVANFDPDVGAIAEDASGILWVGISDRLIRMEQQTNRQEMFRLPDPEKFGSSYNVIVDIAAGKDGTIWLGTYNRGLISFDGKNFHSHTLEPSDPQSIANRTIWSVSQSDDDSLWIGTYGAGLYSFNPATGKAISHHHPDGRFSNEQITSICLSKDKKIYMGTTYGMLIYDKEKNTFEKIFGSRNKDQRFTSMLISHVYEDSRGLLWISTNDGLNIYDRRYDNVIIPAKELEQTMINGIVEDHDKNMWVSCSDGVYHLIVNSDPMSLTYSFAHRKFDDASISDILVLNQKAITKCRTGMVVLGGAGGLSMIDPSDLKYDDSTPKVQITGVQLFNHNVKIDSLYDGQRILSIAPPYAEEIHLDYSQNVFSISFSSMNHMYPEKMRYMYKLEGFDTDWTESYTNKITYTNLAPGKYTLMIKAVNSDGYASKEYAQLRIVVSPPFYQSWMAYVIYAMIFVGILILVKFYLRRREQRKYEVMQIRQDAEKKHEIDDLKLRFFTNISHELRTPLTLILTPLEYVIERIDNPDLKNKLQMAHNNAMRLLAMVNQLLDFRKSDMKGHKLVSTRGNIVDTVRTVCDNFTMYSEHRNISLTFFSSEKKIYMPFDEDKINKIVMNLLSNAFKFTPEGGRVDVSLNVLHDDDSHKSLEIRVADNGCGIKDEHKDMIFERFYQVPQVNECHSTGSGVGLNLVKEFVTLHNGSIRVCDNVDKGVVFIITIPIETAAEPSNEECDENPIQETASEDSPKSDKSDDDHDETDRTRPMILIVDDNDDFRSFMKDCLSAEYTVYEAADGAKAWSLIPELQPDIVVSDVMMPEMDGNELCKTIKNDIRTSHILVILLTARTAKEHELTGLENGADDYITKPFNINILTRRINNLLLRRTDNHKQPMEISPNKIMVTPLDQKLMQKAVTYVEENIERSDLSVEELSGVLAMSRVHLYKKMVSITGKTPIEFIRIIRLKRAAQLLAESQLSVAEITYQTGFNSQSLFRKYFKNEFGLLPSEYQARHGKKYNESI